MRQTQTSNYMFQPVTPLTMQAMQCAFAHESQLPFSWHLLRSSNEILKNQKYLPVDALHHRMRSPMTKFKETTMKNKISHIAIHTDGACQGNPGHGGWAAIITYGYDNGYSSNEELIGSDPDTTNNKMELTGVIKALSVLHTSKIPTPDTPIKIISDSKYVVDGINKWLKNWKTNSWRKSDNQPVKNQELWMEFDSLSQGLSIEAQWIKGHSGDCLNERANELARTAISAQT